MTPVVLEVISPMLSSFNFNCLSCGRISKQLDLNGKHHDYCVEEYPKHYRDSAAKLNEIVCDIEELYKHRVTIRLIDALSPLGIWKQIRHRLPGMPAFVIDGSHSCTGWDVERLESLIDTRLRELC